MGDLLEAKGVSAAPTESEPQTTGQQPPTKKKQKRNKPTLSCAECVERKTKVKDRPDSHDHSYCPYSQSSPKTDLGLPPRATKVVRQKWLTSRRLPSVVR